MNSLNSVLIEGNLTRDPILRETTNGKMVTVFSLASNRYFRTANGKSEQEVSYFDVEVWAAQALHSKENLRKGYGVRVVGRLKQDRWQDENGSHRSKIKIVGDHIEHRSGGELKKSKEEAGGHKSFDKVREPALLETV